MRPRPISAFIDKYHFELILILAELIACTLVALTLLKLLSPPSNLALAAAPQPAPRAFKLATLPPSAAPFEPVGITIAITELPTLPATPRPAPLNRLETHRPGSPPPAQIETPLSSWPVQGAISQDFGCSPYFSGTPGQGCPAERPWFHDGLDLAA
jgi:hypothetical protein